MLKKIISFTKDTQCPIGHWVSGLSKFIRYNTFTAIIIAVAFAAVASTVASNENIKKNVIGEEITEKSGVDNSALLAADLENFDLAMEITGVAEDAELLEGSEPSEDSKSGKAGNYYVGYQYKTLGIQDDVWQKILRQKQMVISKAALGERDLGLYVSEELGEIIDYEIAYLKEVQKNEEKKGQTFVQETTKYTGLIGLVLDTKTKELPGYEPVVKPPVVEEPRFREDSAGPTNGTLDESQGNYDNFTGAPVNGDFSAGSPYYLWLVKNCMDNGKYWYKDTCNAAPEIIPTPLAAPEPTAEAGTAPPSQGGDAGTPDESQEDLPVAPTALTPTTPAPAPAS